MTKYGDLATPNVLYDELPFAVTINAQLNSNQTGAWNLYNYKMPFTGSLSVTTDVGLTWPVTQNMQQMTGVIEASPAMNQGFGFDITEDGRDGRAPTFVGRALGYWSSVPINTTVVINLRVTMSFYGTIIRIDGASGFMRACKG